MTPSYFLEKPSHIPYTIETESRLSGAGKFLEIVLQTRKAVDTGMTAEWEVLRKRDAVVVLPITRSGEMIFLDQFRYPLMDWELEIPAETLDEAGDTPESGAIRALREEIGYCTEQLLRMPTYASSGGTSTELVHSFLALDCVPIPEGPDRSADEMIRVNRVPIVMVDVFLDARITQGQILNPKMDALVGRYMRGNFRF